MIAGCGDVPAPPRVTVLVPDASASMSRPEAQQVVRNTIKLVVQTAPEGSLIFGYPLTDNTEAGQEVPVCVTIPAFDLTKETSDDFDGRIMPNARKDADRQLYEMLAVSDNNQGTDLLHSFRIAAAELDGPAASHCQDRRLVVVSDMIQQSQSCDFMKEHLTPQTDEKIIQGLRASTDLPELHGVRVWIVSNVDPSVPPAKISEIRAFWLLYFRQTGASLDSSQDGPTLLNY